MHLKLIVDFFFHPAFCFLSAWLVTFLKATALSFVFTMRHWKGSATISRLSVKCLASRLHSLHGNSALSSAVSFGKSFEKQSWQKTPNKNSKKSTNYQSSLYQRAVERCRHRGQQMWVTAATLSVNLLGTVAFHLPCEPTNSMLSQFAVFIFFCFHHLWQPACNGL